VEASYMEFDPADPEWIPLTLASDGTRRMLRQRPDGDCTFLGDAGCTLPGEVRPLVCRLYPWAFDYTGVHGEKPEYCPVAMLSTDGRPMVEVLGMQAGDAHGWHRMLYDELREEQRHCVSA
jgi:Fe-S-cluster containining protein